MGCYWQEEVFFFFWKKIRRVLLFQVLKKILILHLEDLKIGGGKSTSLWYDIKDLNTTSFQILCLDSKKILAWCSNQLVATIIKLIFIKERVENIFQNYIQKIQLSLGRWNQKCYSAKDQWANKWAALLATLGTQSKEIGLFIITVY